MKMAKVFYAQPGDALTAGFYYSIDLGVPRGPFKTQLEAGRAARAEIVAEPDPIVPRGVHYTGLLASTISRLLNVEAPPAAFEGADAYEHQQNAAYGVHQLAVKQAGDPRLYRVIVAPAEAPITIGDVRADQHFAYPLGQ